MSRKLTKKDKELLEVHTLGDRICNNVPIIDSTMDQITKDKDVKRVIVGTVANKLLVELLKRIGGKG